MMSGGPGLNFNTNSDLVANNTAAVAREVGCTRNGQSQQDTVACLRQAPVELLTNLSVTAARAARPPFGEGFFFPTYDGDFLPDRPSQLVRAGKVGAQGPARHRGLGHQRRGVVRPAHNSQRRRRAGQFRAVVARAIGGDQVQTVRTVPGRGL